MTKYYDKYLTPNQWSRSQEEINSLKGVVVHWVANPKTTAEQNRNYFESRKDGTKSYGAAHYIIDLNGDIIQCIPEFEVAYHCGSSHGYADLKDKVFGEGANPNRFTIGVELTHLDWEGSFSPETMTSASRLFAWILAENNLDIEDVFTHHEIVGWKQCPKFFVEHKRIFNTWKRSIKREMKNPTKVSVAVKQLNCRKGPSTQYDVERIIKLDDKYDVIGWKDGWMKLDLGCGVFGYASSKYLIF